MRVEFFADNKFFSSSNVRSNPVDCKAKEEEEEEVEEEEEEENEEDDDEEETEVVVVVADGEEEGIPVECKQFIHKIGARYRVFYV